MKTEFLKTLGISDEDIQKIMAENGKDIEVEKTKTRTALDDLGIEKQTRVDLESQIATLTADKGNSEQLQSTIDTLQKQIAARIEEDKVASAEKDLTDRFTALAGDSKFVNDLTKKGIFGEFKEALADVTNKGKGDKELYDSLTIDREGIFSSTNPPVDVPGMNVDLPTKPTDEMTYTELSAYMATHGGAII